MNGKVAVAQRGAIVSGIRAGRTNSEIAGFNSIPISTVMEDHQTVNDFVVSGGKDEDFDIQWKVHKRRSETKRHLEAAGCLSPSSPNVNLMDF